MSSGGDVGDTVNSVETVTGPVGVLAQLVGAPEPALRLLLSILVGYPIAVIYRAYIDKCSQTLVHTFFALTGFMLCIFNYGYDVYHSIIAVWITYLLCQLFHKKPGILFKLNFLFHMSYLLIGYYFTESNDYDIKWTMPHCVLVLRLIGFGFDIADGYNDPATLSKDQKETALKEIPTILELSAYTYFPAAFLVGPQFPFRRYKSFVNGEFRQYNGNIKAGIIRGSLGVMYLTIRQVGAIMWPDDYFLTDDYANASFATRCFHLGLWGKISLYKYISCWLLTEGALITLGFTYAGKTPDGENDWSGCSNVKLQLLETGSRMMHYVQSFNVNTNNWIALYVYKRLKFLNNRTISYAGALLFLAIWHGFHSGYYMSFALEYAIITFEGQFGKVYKAVIQPKLGYYIEDLPIGKVITYVVMKIYNIVCMGWCLVPFIHLRYNKWMTVFASSSHFGFKFLGVWIVIHLIYQLGFNKNHQNPLKRKAE